MATVIPIRIGEDAYLTPRTLGAGSATWSQPKVTVVAKEWPYYTVRLPDGSEVKTHADNLVRRLPAERKRRLVPHPRPEFKDAEEVPLW